MDNNSLPFGDSQSTNSSLPSAPSFDTTATPIETTPDVIPTASDNPFANPAPTSDTPVAKDQPVESDLPFTPTEMTPPEPEEPAHAPEPTPAPTPTPKPAQAAPAVAPKPVTPPAPVPASVPATYTKHSSPTPILFALLGGGLLLTTAGVAFFAVQNQTLKHQLNTLQAIEAQRELPTTTPTPSGTTTPTPTVTTAINAPVAAFTNWDAVISAAQQFSSTAQLLMITTGSVGTPLAESPASLDTSKATYSYWFRKAPGTKEYFFVQTNTDGSGPKVVTPANVSPDNNIPDLLADKATIQSGLDADQAHSLIWTQLLSSYTQGNRPTVISAKFLKSAPSNPDINTPVNLWQITYKFDAKSGIKDVVVQVNAATKTIIYSNLPKNAATVTSTPTVSPTATATPAGS